jgi:hypothetical protein
MKHVLILFSLITIGNIVFGQSTPQDISTRFFVLYKTGDSDKAIDYLFSSSPYKADITEAIEEVKRKLKKAVIQVGPFYNADLLATKTAGANIIMLTYIVRHEREPFVFNIMFYKPNDKWQMQNFKFGNAIDDELEEASKAYRIKENAN